MPARKVVSDQQLQRLSTASPSPPPVSPPFASPEEPQGQAGPSSSLHDHVYTPRQPHSVEAQPPQWAVDFKERQAASLETLALCARDMVASNQAVVAEATALREWQAASSREVVAALREHTSATRAATAAQEAATAARQATGDALIAVLRNILAPR